MQNKHYMHTYSFFKLPNRMFRCRKLTDLSWWEEIVPVSFFSCLPEILKTDRQ